jgi:hypothetical protein
MKKPMSTSYKLVFFFSILMIFSVLILGSATGTKSSGFGLWVWGYTAWLMYKRNNVSLVGLYKVLLGFDIFACVVVFVVMLFSDGDVFKIIGYSQVGFIMLLGLVTLITYGMYSYFKAQIESKINSYESAHSTSSDVNNKPLKSPSTASKLSPLPSEDLYWEMALDELNNNKHNVALWARIFSEVDGDVNKTKARYLKFRVQELSAEAKNISERKLLTNTVRILRESILNFDKNTAQENFNVGMSIYNGIEGFDADHFMAFKFIHNAALGGVKNAQFNLSLMYWKGDGVERDKAKAYAWTRLASSHIAEAKDNVQYFAKDMTSKQIFDSDDLVVLLQKLIAANTGDKLEVLEANKNNGIAVGYIFMGLVVIIVMSILAK